MYATSCLMVILLFWCFMYSTSCEPVFAKNDYNGLFPKNTVIDISNGSTDDLFNHINRHEITFVMFYAPWSGQCIKFVPEFLKLLKLLNHSVISIIAINCWVGRCRSLFQTFYFPRMFLYHTKHNPIEYFGAVNAKKILKFMEMSIRPWVYIGNEHDLTEFSKKYDSNVICYMNPFSLHSNKRYDIFFLAALSLINRVDPPKVGVIVNRNTAMLMKLSVHGELCSRNSFRDDLYYLQSANYTSHDILHWMIIHNRQIINTLSPNATYTNFYIEQLRQGPVVILPFNSHQRSSYKRLNTYRHAATSYYHCSCYTNQYIRNYKTTKQTCLSFKSKRKMLCSLCCYCLHYCYCRPIISVEEHLSVNIGHCVSWNGFISENFSKCCVSTSLVRSRSDLISRELNYTKSENETMSTLNLASVMLNQIQMNNLKSHHSESDDMQSTNSRLLRNDIEKCGPAAPCCFPQEVSRKKHTFIFAGLACRTNKTLSFYVMDVDQHSYILNNLGYTNTSAMMIVDVKREEKFHLDAAVTATSIEHFILQFTMGELQQRYNSTRPHGLSTSKLRKYDLEIMELTSSSFRSAVFDNTKNVFVMFYAVWCGVCKAVSLIFLNLAKFYVTHDVVFQRIDADINELPWQFVPNFYPSFILFRAFRKDYSISYPDDQEITLNNFVDFLDRHL